MTVHGGGHGSTTHTQCQVCGCWEPNSWRPEGKGARGETVCSDCYLDSPGQQAMTKGSMLRRMGEIVGDAHMAETGRETELRGFGARQDEIGAGVPARRERRIGERGGKPLPDTARDWAEKVVEAAKAGRVALAETRIGDGILDAPNGIVFVHVELRDGGGFRHTLPERHALDLLAEIGEHAKAGGSVQPIPRREMFFGVRIADDPMSPFEGEHAEITERHVVYCGEIPVTMHQRGCAFCNDKDGARRETILWKAKCDCHGAVETVPGFMASEPTADGKAEAVEVAWRAGDGEGPSEKWAGGGWNPVYMSKERFDRMIATRRPHALLYDIMSGGGEFGEWEPVSFGPASTEVGERRMAT